jgi:hypothetical protein
MPRTPTTNRPTVGAASAAMLFAHLVETSSPTMLSDTETDTCTLPLLSDVHLILGLDRNPALA